MGELLVVGSVKGYLTKPGGSGPWPALVVIQEWYGLDEQTKRIAERFAGVGCLSFAPDLYDGELAALGDHEKASSLVQKHGPAGPAKLQMVFDGLKDHPDCNGKIGAVGFCFGGRMALTLAINRPLNAVCTFYGGNMQILFDQLHQIKCPVLGLFGDEDESIPIGTVEQFEKLLTQHGIENEVKVYPNSGHAFFRDMDPRVYRPDAAKDAWVRVTNFFSKNLRK